MMNNYWLMRLATQNSRGSTPASEESIMILGGVLLLLVLLMIAFCVYMWWDSRPTDVFAEYLKKTDRNPKPKAEAETQENKPISLSVRGVLGTAALAMRVLNFTGEKDKGGLM